MRSGTAVRVPLPGLPLRRRGHRGGRTHGRTGRGIGTTGFRYADRTGSSNGVRALALRGGRKTDLSCSAKRGEAGLPRNIASALAESSSVTMQLHAGPDACFSTTLTEIKKQTDTLFKAK